MTITRLRSAKRMSQIVTANGFVFLAGQVAKGAEGQPVAEQTAAILKSIDELLREAGTGKDKIVSATIWLTDISRFDEMNGVWDAWVSEGASPARACVEGALATPDYTVEIMVTATL